MEPDLKRIRPTVQELNEVYRSLRCTICNALFKTEPNLNLHLSKTHRLDLPSENAKTRIYHCPIITCMYNKNMSFKSFKLLKQHYMKVHKEKTHKCFSCNEVFPNEFFRDRHYEYCNIQFRCCDCDAYYYRYETLKTHSRRKKHKILEKNDYRVILGRIEVRTKNQGSQTDLKTKASETQTILMKKNSRQTTHTQTDGNKKKTPMDKKSIDTQTEDVASNSASVNTSFEINDLEFGRIERSSSATQTNTDPIVSYDSAHTDTSDLTEELQTSVFNSMETQTDLMFTEDIFNCDYSNMYTQTCENLLLNMCGLNDTETQTVLDDCDLRSVESQTVMTNLALKEGASLELTHMETQTDTEFKEIFEEIKA